VPGSSATAPEVTKLVAKAPNARKRFFIIVSPRRLSFDKKNLTISGVRVKLT
jgi:hypothetical protein